MRDLPRAGTPPCSLDRSIMQFAPRLIFHDVDPPHRIESYVTRRLTKLDRRADGVTSCRATLAREQSSHRHGNLSG
jgi:hypothetical protein